MKVTMGSNGMDGGLFGVKEFGGGRYSFKICQGIWKCCETENFGTEDDNWEKFEVNYFVGKQLLQCENFLINEGQTLTIEARHSGGDGSIIQNITLYGSKYRGGTFHSCPIGVKLDHSETQKSTCEENSPHYVYYKSCNGDAKFCNLTLNEVTFAGAHNAGTGMADQVDPVACFVKNNDLSVTEMLDFGIRHLDFDIKLHSDNILYTGHGPENFYYRFAKLQNVVDNINAWMEEHESEIIILRFGELLGPKIDVYKELRRILIHSFTNVGEY